VEFRHAVTHEGAATLSDVLTRRTHLVIERTDGGTAAAPAVAGLLAPLLGWDETRQAREVAEHRAEVERDRTALGSAGPAPIDLR
jgi:glycerol-3-phosphate dehydrogenase